MTPESGYRFIVVGFPIRQEQTLAVDDYELHNDLFRLPLAVGGENPMAPHFFYDPDQLAETVALTRGSDERNVVQTQDPEEGPLLTGWTTPASTLLLLFEVPENAQTVTLRHGRRSYQLNPETGRITASP